MFCASNFRCLAFPVTFANRSASADNVEKERMTLTTTTRSFRFSIAKASLPMMTKMDGDPGVEECCLLPRWRQSKTSEAEGEGVAVVLHRQTMRERDEGRGDRCKGKRRVYKRDVVCSYLCTMDPLAYGKSATI